LIEKMSARNGALEVFRLISLAAANQWHLQHPYDFQYNRAGGLASYWHTSVWLTLGFAMSGLLQIATLFSVRSAFRARGIGCFWLTLILYGRFFSPVFRYLGLPDGSQEPKQIYPITKQLSWFSQPIQL
jgi:hypothetical protein